MSPETKKTVAIATGFCFDIGCGALSPQRLANSKIWAPSNLQPRHRQQFLKTEKAVIDYIWARRDRAHCSGGSVAKNRLKVERGLTIFSETFDERFQVASFSGRCDLVGGSLVLPLWSELARS